MFMKKFKKLITVLCFFQIICFPVLTRAEKFSFVQRSDRYTLLQKKRLQFAFNRSRVVKQKEIIKEEIKGEIIDTITTQYTCNEPAAVKSKGDVNIIATEYMCIDPRVINETNSSENIESKSSEDIFDNIIIELSKAYGTDPALIKAMVHVESSFNPNARSKVGAMGLMQLMPATAREMGVKNPYEAKDNLQGGIKYISKLLNKYKGKIDLSLAAYNAGPTKVRRYKGIPPYRETKNYVTKVMNLHKHYSINR